jgi:tRNA threonylcarbamoyladenosine biosynthesis protein TsaB
MLLAIDTATQNLSLALHDGGEVLFEQTWRSLNQHTIELAPAVEAALRRLGGESLSAVAVAIGPGTYTGLRVGVSFAKALAAARRVPLVGVNTLDIVAAAQPAASGQAALAPVVAAGRTRVVAALYAWRKGRWKPRTEPQVTDWDGLLALLDGPAVIAGEIDADGRERLTLARAGGAQITLAPAPLCVRRAAWLAEEGWSRLRAAASEDETTLFGKDRTTFDPAHVTPLYARTKDVP